MTCGTDAENAAFAEALGRSRDVTAVVPSRWSASGPAHVATASFLASRAVPTGGFWVALAGGTALARVAQRRGAREGYGASVAATIETVAIMGPARFGVPFTQAVSAPMLGRMEARGFGPLAQILACAAVRVATNAAGVAFFIWVIAGGLDAYAGSYDALAERFGFTLGERGTLVLTGVALIAWGAFASWVQVGVYRRGLGGWPAAAPRVRAGGPRAGLVPARQVRPARGHHRGDPAFGLLLAGTAWALLGAVAAWLALAWLLSRPDYSAVPTGLALAALLAGGAFLFVWGGGLGLDEALRRAARAGLLVLVATWLRAAAGVAGLREVARRSLGRLSRVPCVPEAARTLDAIGSEGRLAASGRQLLEAVRGVPRRPLPFLDAVLGWVAAESARFAPGVPGPPLTLRVRAFDVALVAAAVLPLLALVA